MGEPAGVGFYRDRKVKVEHPRLRGVEGEMELRTYGKLRKRGEFSEELLGRVLRGVGRLQVPGDAGRISELAGDQKVDMGRRPDSLLALLGLSEDPGYRDLEFPLSVGKKWNYTYRARLRGERIPFLRSVEISVVGIEQITTAAGTFSAFKLVKEDWYRRSRWITTYFYSPETRSVVKSLYDSSVGSGSGGKREIELVKFGSAR